MNRVTAFAGKNQDRDYFLIKLANKIGDPRNQEEKLNEIQITQQYEQIQTQQNVLLNTPKKGFSTGRFMISRFFSSNPKNKDEFGYGKTDSEPNPYETVGFKQGETYCQPCEEYKRSGRISLRGTPS